MNGGVSHREWKENTEKVLRDIESIQSGARHDPMDLGTNLSSGLALLNLRETQHRIFSRPLDGLIDMDYIMLLIRQAANSRTVESEELYRRLRNIREEAEKIRTRARECIMSSEKEYDEIVDIVIKIHQSGVWFEEAEKLKSIAETSRRIEQAVIGNYLSVDQLFEIEGQLAGEKQVGIKSIEEVIQVKKQILDRLDSSLMGVLSQTQLSIEDMSKVSVILDEANQSKCKLAHFRYICDIRDTFRWLHVLDQFLEMPGGTVEQLQAMIGRLMDTKTTNEISIEGLRQRLEEYVCRQEEEEAVAFVRVALEPMKGIELIDESVRRVMDTIEAGCWVIQCRSMLKKGMMSADELGEWLRRVPNTEIEMVRCIKEEMEEARVRLEELERRLRLLAQEARDFIEASDGEIISSRVGQARVDELNQRWQREMEARALEVGGVGRVEEREAYRECRGLIAAVNCFSMMHTKGWVGKDTLEEVGCLFGVWGLGFGVAVRSLIDMLNQKKIVFELVGAVNERAGEPNVDDKIDIVVARRCIEEMRDEEGFVDYSEEVALIAPFLEKYNEWEARAVELLDRVDLGRVEQESAEGSCKEVLETYREEVRSLVKEYSCILFNSEIVLRLDGLDWCLEAIEFLYGRRRKRYEWDTLCKRGKEVAEVAGNMFRRVRQEVEGADRLKFVAQDVYKEKVSYRVIRKLKQKLDECRIDMIEEVAYVKERLELENRLFQKLMIVINSEEKFRVVDLEKVSEEIRQSGIDFEEIGKRFETTVQICKAFITAVKEMRKTPKDIKGAKHLYNTLPLSSSYFNNILRRLEEDEKILDEVNDRMEDPDQSWEGIGKIEETVCQIKYYDVSSVSMQLMKFKVSMMMRHTTRGDNRISVTYSSLKLMRESCVEHLKKFEDDEETEICLSYIDQQIEDADRYIEKISHVRVITMLDDVRQFVGIINVSSEIQSLRSRMRMRLSKQSSSELRGEPQNRDSWNVNLLSGSLNHSKHKKFDLKLVVTPPKSLVTAPKPSIIIPSFSNTDKMGSIGLPSKSKLNPPLHKAIPLIKPSIHQTTNVISSNISRHQKNRDIRLERDIGPSIRLEKGGRSEEQGGMSIVRNGMSNHIKLLIQYNPYISEMEDDTINACSKIERSVFSHSLINGSYVERIKKVIKLFEYMVKLKRISKLVVRKEYDTDIILYLADQKLDYLVSIDGDKKKLIHAIKSSYKDSIGKRLSVNSSQDAYDIRKLSYKHTTEDSNRNNKMEDVLKDADKLVESLKVSLKNVSQYKDVNVISEDSSSEEDRLQRNRKKKPSPKELKGMERSSDKRNSQPRSAYSGLRTRNIDQPIWSIFKGTLHFEFKSSSGNKVSVKLDYSDLVTIEEKYIISTFPKLPDKIELRGLSEHLELNAHLEKMAKRSSQSFGYLIGFLKSSDSIESLNKLVHKTKTSFVCKCTPYSKLFFFHKNSYKKDAMDQSEGGSRKLYQANSDYYWLLVYNVYNATKEKASLSMIDPHPVYGQSLIPVPRTGNNRSSMSSEEENGFKGANNQQPRYSGIKIDNSEYRQSRPGQDSRQNQAGQFNRGNDEGTRRNTHDQLGKSKGIIQHGNSLLNELKAGNGSTEDDAIKPVQFGRNFAKREGIDPFGPDSNQSYISRAINHTRNGTNIVAGITPPVKREFGQGGGFHERNRHKMNPPSELYPAIKFADNEENSSKNMYKQSQFQPDILSQNQQYLNSINENKDLNILPEERISFPSLSKHSNLASQSFHESNIGEQELKSQVIKKRTHLMPTAYAKRKIVQRIKTNTSSYPSQSSMQEVEVSSYEENSSKKKKKKKRRRVIYVLPRWKGSHNPHC